MTTLDSLTPSEQRELTALVDSITEAIVRTLLQEVDDPIVRRLAVTRVAERFGLKVER